MIGFFIMLYVYLGEKRTSIATPGRILLIEP